VTFPALEVEPGRVIADSDAIVALYAEKTGLDPAKAPFYAYVMAGPFRRIREAFADRGNWSCARRADARQAWGKAVRAAA
jgi:hypothetical protein